MPDVFQPLYRVHDLDRSQRGAAGLDLSTLAKLDRGILDSALFADKAIYRTEVQEIFGSSWLFLGHEDQVQNPGDWVRSRMGNQSIIVVRNADGELRAFINTCRHAGYRLCPDDRGSATRFQCELHGWTYDLDGRFVAMAGYGDESDRRLAREAGFERHLVKPVDILEIEELLAAMLTTPRT